MKSAQLFIDYQNLHLSAHDRFDPFGPIHRSVIHPVMFANCLEKVRNSLVYEAVHIDSIHVFRGQPSNEHEHVAAGRNKAQAAEWTRDRRVTIHSRALRYPRDWPTAPAREKGVDVALAIAFIRAAIETPADVLILASRDTDLLPALEAARTIDGAIVEVGGWEGDSRLRFSGPENKHRLWNTQLKDEHYRNCLDPRTYA